MVSVDSAEVMSRLLTAFEAEKARLAADDGDVDEGIDYSDIPELSDEQLGQARRVRVGRPPIGAVARKMISMKIDPGLLEELKARAKREGKGYQTLIHAVLEAYVEDDTAA